MSSFGNGCLVVTLKGLLWAKDPEVGKDFELHVLVRDGVFDEVAEGRAPTYHGSLSWITFQQDYPHWTFKGLIVPDAWVPFGGKVEGEVVLNEDGSGQYTVTHRGLERRGVCEVKFVERAPAQTQAPEGLPDILHHFMKEGPKGRLYDFSRAGFHHGEEPGADPDLPLFPVTDFGAFPDSGEDSRDAVQAAVDAAVAAGGGVVEFPPGRFDFSLFEKKDAVEIAHSRVVIRGSGSGRDGTLLVNHRPSPSPDHSRPWEAGYFPGFFHVGAIPCPVASTTDIAQAKVAEVVEGKRGDYFLTLAEETPLEIGRTYLFQQLEDGEGSLARHLVMEACEPAANYRGEGKPLVRQLVKVMGQEGKRVDIDTKLHLDVGSWVAELREVELLHHVGIEHLRLRSCWEGYFEHHINPEHDNGWDHIKFEGIEDCWMRNLIHENTTSAGGFKDSRCCTAMDCRIVGNPAHNGYATGGCATDNLFLRMDAGQQMHGFNIQSTMCGNVFLDCQMDEPGGLDFHGGIGLDNLFDNLLGGVNTGGGGPGAVPPRHSRGLVFWNVAPGRYTPYKPWKEVRELADLKMTPGLIAVGCAGRYGQPLEIRGLEGKDIEGEARDDLIWLESRDRHVIPRSLYRWQRELARGDVPDWLKDL